MRLAKAAGLARPQRKSPSSSATRPTRHSAASKPPMVQATGRQRPDRGTIDDLRLDPRSAITRGPHLNILWAAFDDPQGELRSRERHVEGNYGLGEALEGER